MDKPHKRLIAWQKCMDLVVLVYELTKSFPPEEKYGLAFQMRKSAVSAPSNISKAQQTVHHHSFAIILEIAIG